MYRLEPCQANLYGLAVHEYVQRHGSAGSPSRFGARELFSDELKPLLGAKTTFTWSILIKFLAFIVIFPVLFFERITIFGEHRSGRVSVRPIGPATGSTPDRVCTFPGD